MKISTPLLRSVFVISSLFLAAPVAAQEGKPISVVATFSIIGDMVKRVGGDAVKLTTLVGPGGDAHIYQPTPADAASLSKADVLIMNGLDFEGWIKRLIQASESKAVTTIATRGVLPLKADEHEDEGHDKHDKHDDKKSDDHAGHDHGAFDPHAWQSIQNAIIYVDNITNALAKAAPVNATYFYKNRAEYVSELRALEAQIKKLVQTIPPEQRTVVTSHDAFGYFAETYGLSFVAPQGLSTESEASAQEVANLIQQIRKEKISAVFIETITDNRLLEQIASETGASIGGTIFSDALSPASGPASTYLKMMRHNTITIAKALGS